MTFTAAALAVIGCEEASKPSPPAAPVDGIAIVSPGAEPRRGLRYQLAAGTTTALELAMDVDLRTFDVAIQVPTFVIDLELGVTAVEPSGTAKLALKVVGASVRARNDDPKATSIIAVMDRQAKQLAGLVITSQLAPSGEVAASQIEQTNRDLAAPLQEQVAAMLQVSEQIAMPLPPQPLGTGAKWTHRRTIKQNQLTLTAVTTVEITQIDGDRISFTSTSDLTGPDQTITRDGATAQVTQIRGNGSQRGTFDLATAALHGETRATLTFEMIAEGQRRPTRFDLVTRLGPRTQPAEAPRDAGAP